MKTAKRRLAGPDDRAVARCLAAALRHPLQKWEPAPADAVVLSMEQVIYLLEHFAAHGTFDLEASAAIRSRRWREDLVPIHYRNLREDGYTYEKAVAVIADEEKISDGTVRALLRATADK